MELVISLLLGLVIVVMLLPTKLLFPNREFKKIVHKLEIKTDKIQEKKSTSESILDKIALLGYKIVRIFKLRYSVTNAKLIEQKLIKAGLNKRFSVNVFLGLKIGMVFLGGIYGGLLSLMTDVFMIKVLCYLVAPIGYFWPNIWIENLIQSRRYKIHKEMPFVLSSVAIIVESGQSLFQAIKEVSEMKEGVLVEEFQLVALEVDMGFSRTEAFERMIDRVQITELSIFLSALIQSIEKGSTGIAQLLKKQSDEMWKKRKEKAKEMAEKASIKLFLPLLLFVLPSMMIFILTPAILSLLKMF